MSLSALNDAFLTVLSEELWSKVGPLLTGLTALLAGGPTGLMGAAFLLPLQQLVSFAFSPVAANIGYAISSIIGLIKIHAHQQPSLHSPASRPAFLKIRSLYSRVSGDSAIHKERTGFLFFIGGHS
ncbi:hypothetical protein FHG87_007446 [Trinorchestia longiramus]|nr:hypothetical protein FHG87_007446 [Trinorchestia longiramus]